MKLIKKSEVAFADSSLQKEFENLGEGEEIKEYIKRAVRDLQENCFCGIQIPKRLIPEIYIKKYIGQSSKNISIKKGNVIDPSNYTNRTSRAT